MNTNVGSIDRVARIIAGVALIGATLSQVIGFWGMIGIVPLVTGVIGYCPAYHLLGFSTCRGTMAGVR